MFKFDKFPTKLQYDQTDIHSENVLTSVVLVHGMLCDNRLVVVEELDHTCDVCVMTWAVFQERFKDYVVVDD